MPYNDSQFDFGKYGIPTIKGTGENGKEQLTSYVDGTDALANAGFVVSFYHLPSQKSLYFKAFITAFNETYNSDWASETVYGRADPIYMFKNTQRKVTLAFKVPAGSAGEAYENLAKVQQLVQFLYPAYTEINSATTICQSPLVRLKVMNLLSAEKMSAFADIDEGILSTEGGGATESDGPIFFEAYQSTSEATGGLLGVINNVSINHNIDNPEHGVVEKAENTILPKMIEVNLDFSPIHEHTVGWLANTDGDADFADSSFPYSAPLFDGAKATASEDVSAASFGSALDGLANTDEYLSDAQAAAKAAEDIDAAVQAAIDTAESRYSGMLGRAREKADARAVEKGTATEYQQLAQAGTIFAEAYDPED